MSYFLLFIAVFFTFNGHAQSNTKHDPLVSECGNDEVDELEVLLFENELRHHRAQRDSRSSARNSLLIPVAFHAISDVINGIVDLKSAQEQVDVLNKAYQPFGIEFSLQSYEETVNPQWFIAEKNSAEVIAMKTILHSGDAGTLNIYSFTPADDLNGNGTFPWKYKDHPLLDGIIIKLTTRPGGEHETKNLGYTLVHEVGHWLSLFHTFKGGCSDPNDYIDDTPKQSHAIWKCSSEPSDSCAKDNGYDPLQNFMGYAWDICRSEFTPMQIERIYDAFEIYRAKKIR